MTATDIDAVVAGKLRELIEAQKQVTFTDPASADSEDALGVLLAHFFKWDGAAILRVAAWALTDANFHDESAKVLAIERGVG